MAETIANSSWRARVKPSLMVGPLAILLVIAMIIVPLPGFMLSFLFALNIAAGLLILATSLYILSPTDLTAFPSLLLITTLARLALNVATARVILLHGYEGPTAAGAVIESFGEFVVGGNYVVGFIIFVILIVINFVVVTKGAGRVAEVGARFVLDSMPGKQMAIDADLNAGMLEPKQAEKRRDDVRKEADFFGAMDGASKFIRGDVIAAIIILAINLIAGLAVGMLQHGLPLAAAARTYTLLTIGDGLAAQIPSLTISIAAGLVVTRVASGQDVGAQVAAQIGRFPQALAAAAALMTVLGLVPGMAHWPFILLALALGGASWIAYRRQEANPEGEAESSGSDAAGTPDSEKSLAAQNPPEGRDVSGVDPLGLEIGFALVPLIEHEGQRFLDRMRSIRDRFAQRMGFQVPPVHIRDSDQLSPNQYRFTIRGASVGGAEIMPEMWLAITGPSVTSPLETGRETIEPAYGSKAYWIEHDDIDMAEALGYTVVDPQSAIATHLDQILVNHGHELLGRAQVDVLMDKLADYSPKLAEEVQRHLSTSTIKQVLENLLVERIPIRDIERVCETALDAAMEGEKDPAAITERARVSLGRFIIDWVSDGAETLEVAVLHHDLEELIARGVATARDNGVQDSIEPTAAQELRQSAQLALERFNQEGRAPILAVQSAIRRPVARSIAPIAVIALEEIPHDKTVQVLFTIPDEGAHG